MRRPDYQNLNDDLEEITDRRNAEIRAWGKQVLADSDALLLSGQVRDAGSWDLISDEDEPSTLPPELQEHIEQQIADVERVPKPRTKIVDSDVESPAKGKKQT